MAGFGDMQMSPQLAGKHKRITIQAGLGIKWDPI
jgi:hypothetical protein